MAVTLQNADNALKSVYLDVVAEQLNTGSNPFLAAIKHSTEDVWRKEVRKLVTHGINGGIGAGSEDGNLPAAQGNNYKQLVTTLKNLYGTIEISDKAIRASENNAGAFVNLLNAEMEGLVKSSTFNFSRMLFGDGSGVIAKVEGCLGNKVLLTDNSILPIEGTVIDFYKTTGQQVESSTARTILKVDRANKEITVSGAPLVEEEISGCLIVASGSYNSELTGLKAIFDSSIDNVYGLSKSENPWLKPYVSSNVQAITEAKLQKAIDEIEEQSGSAPNFIICSWGVRRALQNLFATSNTRVETLNLAGGFTAMSYNGIPIVVDRFCPKGTLYMLNTNDFALHQLCDWQWLTGDDGKVLKQIPGKPVYTATLVKYAELLCSRPCGQGMLSGITEA